MKIIHQNPNPSGSYPPIQEADFNTVPDGTALWPDALPTDVFYQYNGFVTLDIQDVDGTPTVTACGPNVAAWEEWKNTTPEEPEPAEKGEIDLMADAYKEGVNEA